MDLLANLRRTFGDRMAYYRAKRDWTQHDLAAASNIKVGALRNWEQCKRWPRAEEIEKIAHAFGVRPVDLMTGPEDLHTPQSQIIDIFNSLDKTQRDGLLSLLKGFQQSKVGVKLDEKGKKSG